MLSQGAGVKPRDTAARQGLTLTLQQWFPAWPPALRGAHGQPALPAELRQSTRQSPGGVEPALDAGEVLVHGGHGSGRIAGGDRVVNLAVFRDDAAAILRH